MVLNILLGEDDIKGLIILYLANNSHVNIIVSSNSILNVFINSFFVLFFLMYFWCSLLNIYINILPYFIIVVLKFFLFSVVYWVLFIFHFYSINTFYFSRPIC